MRLLPATIALVSLGYGAQAWAVPTCSGWTVNRTVCAVGCNDSTIAAAVTAATNNQVVCVEAGTYTAAISVSTNKKVVVVEGDGQAVTISGGSPASEIVLLQSDGDLDLYGVTVNGNSNRRCFNVNSSGSVLTLDAVTVDGCVQGTDGPAIYNNGGTVVTRNGTVLSNNGAGGNNGGTLYSNGGTVTMTDTTVSGSDADAGGALYLTSGTTATITDSTFSSNTCDTGDGGAIYVNDGSLTIAGGLFFDARATASGSDGGAIDVNGSADVTVDGTTFDSCRADDDGGAIHHGSSGTLTVEYAIFFGNDADFDNSGGGDGGAVAATSGDFSVVQSIFEGNSADYGGAIHSAVAGAAVNGSLFCANDAGTSGGAANLTTSGTATYWDNNVFELNTCSGDGGGVRVAGGSGSEFRNNAFAKNDCTGTDGFWINNNGNALFSSNLVAFHAGTGAHQSSGGGALTSEYNLYWSNGTDESGTSGNTGDLFGVDPEVASWTDNGTCDDDFSPFDSTSPLVDGGDPDPLYDDPDGSINDIGPSGGPNGPDRDGDGYLFPTDCDDDDPAVHPGATEIAADGTDGNCDDLELCYQDTDNDGYGTATTVSSATITCVGAGIAPNNADCNGTDPAINPDASEIVGDNIDQDCDGLVSCWQDNDNDNFGSSVVTTDADGNCTDNNEATVNGDCNDASAIAFPGGTEVTADGIDGNCDTFETCYVDGDTDGYGSTATTQSTTLTCVAAGIAPNNTDCADGNAARNPGATEQIANSTDDNCDGSELCYQDLDNDDHGTSLTTVSSDTDCTDANEAINSTDCNDSNPSINPAATELPGDGIDQNCDTDELCYEDDDGDGVAGDTTRNSNDLDCTDNNEFATNGDCNDANANVSPNLPEIIGDGVDQDCDGNEDCYFDGDGDGYGGPIITSTDLDCTDANEETVGGDCNDSLASINPAAVEIVADGVDGNCNTTESCYQDSDNDGFGGSTVVQSSILSCTGTGISTNNSDCNNTVATIYPGATEVVGDGVDQSCDGIERCWVDGDGDTFGGTGQVNSTADTDCNDPGEATSSTDCNDGNAAIKPGAVELVDDGVDQNCDNSELCWRDTDGDTYGSTSTQTSTALTCIASGVATNNTDCNDSVATIYPGAPETIGDTVDQDCNGTDSIYCWTDADEDGYGVAPQVVASDGVCETNEGESTLNTDCDDGDDTRHPGAPEVKDDGVDQDCDGGDLTDCYEDADNDGFGANPPVIVPFDGDCGPAAFMSDVASDCDDDVATTFPGAADVCGDGVDANCDGVYDEDGDGMTYTDEVLLGTDDCLVDTDADGIEDGDEVGYGSNPIDADTDNDTLLDGDEWGPNALPVDTDQDGLYDPLDSDDDDDLVPTAAEVGVAGGDNDLDGTPNHLDDDDDDDTIPTADEDRDGDGNPRDDDTDNDAVADWLDADDDDDGLFTDDELAAGANPWEIDSDGDTVLDDDEWGSGGVARDSDTDGVADIIDPDDDDDTIPTQDEGVNDLDGDQIPNHLDPDSDGDTATDQEEYARPGEDTDNDGIVDWWDANDADGDTGDGDFDGATNGEEALAGTNPIDPDTNDDGVPDGDEIGGSPASPLDTDYDLEPDWSDTDDDGDGIPTADETGLSCPDPKDVPTIEVQGGAMVILCGGTATGDPIVFQDTDLDGTPDYLDPDDDDDGIPTIDEDPLGDEDGDGTPDYVDILPEDGPLGDQDGDGLSNEVEIDQGSSPYTDDTDQDGVLDPQEIGDTDEDGTPDFADPDDDDDGIPTADEGQVDTDGDGDPDHLDLDSDDDGRPDAAEGTADSDCDGVPDRVDDRDDPACGHSGASGGRTYERQGCGCDASTGGTAGLLAVAAAGLVLRRRRR